MADKLTDHFSVPYLSVSQPVVGSFAVSPPTLKMSRVLVALEESLVIGPSHAYNMPPQIILTNDQ